MSREVRGFVVGCQESGVARVPGLNEDPDVDLVALGQPLHHDQAARHRQVIIAPACGPKRFAPFSRKKGKRKKEETDIDAVCC